MLFGEVPPAFVAGLQFLAHRLQVAQGGVDGEVYITGRLCLASSDRTVPSPASLVLLFAIAYCYVNKGSGVKATAYYRNSVLVRRPELATYAAYVKQALLEPVEAQVQPDGRIRHWIYVPEEKKYLRIVTLADGETVHNGMFDSAFTRRATQK